MEDYMNFSKMHFEGERALFRTSDSRIEDCLFDNGESPLKECRNLEVSRCTFGYKYPLWYGKGHHVKDCKFLLMSRSGIWYTDDSVFENLDIIAPKEFRHCRNISLTDIEFRDAEETLWWCKDVKLRNVRAKGDYFLMQSQDVTIENLVLDGNYVLDGGKNIVIRNSVLNSKDAFWNCENVLVENCVVNGEYLAWNSKNITFRHCRITSHQGLCYVDGLVMEDCTLTESDLTFEYCKDIKADITSDVDSIKNPISGIIKARSVKEIIQDDERIDTSKIRIETEGE